MASFIRLPSVSKWQFFVGFDFVKSGVRKKVVYKLLILFYLRGFCFDWRQYGMRYAMSLIAQGRAGNKAWSS